MIDQKLKKGLKKNKSFKQIGKYIGKDCTNISKEVKIILFIKILAQWVEPLIIVKIEMNVLIDIIAL